MDIEGIRTLTELLDAAVDAYADRPAVALRRDDGSREGWTYRELRRRADLAAWRLHALGLEPGDRILTWAPSSPGLAAAYFGAIRDRLILVPLDLRMAPEAVDRIVQRARPRRLILGTGRDAPDPRPAGLEHFPTTLVDDLVADPDDTFPADWEARLAALPRPEPSDVFDLIFTSGTTGTPKGAMLAHDNMLASIRTFHRLIPPMHHRIVSLLPLSHLFEQSVGLFYALSVGADILYVRSLNPRVLLAAFRDHRVTSMIVVPQGLDLFWSSIEREAERLGQRSLLDRARPVARHLPYALRRWLFRRLHAQLGGELRLFVSAGAFLPPALQQAWEDIGVTVLQGYGATETGTGCCTTLDDHGLGTVGRPPEGVEMRLADDGEILFRGRTLFKGYWDDAAATAAAFDAEGWYHSGDLGHFDAAGRLVLQGRKKDMIVLPNGFNVYPEDIENALRIAGIRDSVVLETRPGRIEAILLAPGSHSLPGGATDASGDGMVDQEPARVGARIDAAVKEANRTLGPNQRIQGWRLWPGDDFPRTLTMKVRRNVVSSWVAISETLPPHEALEVASAQARAAAAGAPGGDGALRSRDGSGPGGNGAQPGPAGASAGRRRRFGRARR